MTMIIIIYIWEKSQYNTQMQEKSQNCDMQTQFLRKISEWQDVNSEFWEKSQNCKFTSFFFSEFLVCILEFWFFFVPPRIPN